MKMVLYLSKMNNLHEQFLRVGYMQTFRHTIMEDSNQSWENIQGLSWMFFDE